jgi:subtilase family serine protease
LRSLPRTPLVGLAVVALVTASGGAAMAAGGGSNSRTLPGSIPAWANTAHRVGSTDASQSIGFRVYLDNRDQAAAAKYASAVSTKGNALYGKFLTPQQYRSKFSPTDTSVAAVKSWLRGQGFTIGAVPTNNKYVEAVGTVAQAAKTFDTSFATYRFDGATMRSNTTALAVPNSLSQVEAVVGLDESAALVHTDAQKQAPPPGVFNNAEPMSTYWGEKSVASNPTPHGVTIPQPLPYGVQYYAPKGYAGGQLQGAYGLTSTLKTSNDGSGVTVAVIDAYASPTIVSDVNQYVDFVNSTDPYKPAQPLSHLSGANFKQVVAPGTFVRPQNPKQDPQGWSGEQTLDIESVHTMAPGADIVYVGSPNNYRDLDAIMNKVVDGHLADIVTNSYGYGGEALPPGYIKPQQDTYIQAAAVGMSLFFSSGDAGDETGAVQGATPTPDWPASSPWVTAVGGTSLGVTASNDRQFEFGWQTGKITLDTSTTPATWPTKITYNGGAGGGTSRLFAQPSYQTGVVPADMSKTYDPSGPAMRVVPDVAALADPNTGMLVGQTQTQADGTSGFSFYRIGGTSLASPLYAGMFALAVQNHGEYGLANPALYSTRTASKDITKAGLTGAQSGDLRVDYANTVDASDGYLYSVRLFDWDQNLTIHVQDGYDDITGVGSPNGSAWLAAVSTYHG